MVKYCQTCGLLDPSQQFCRRHGMQVDPATDFCSKHQGAVEYCEVCGKTILTATIDVSIEGELHFLCANCAQERNTCRFCSHNILCSFENDPSPLPKMVLKTINQDNMVMQAQVMNPDRIRETCQKNCKCFDVENGCLRQNNYCGQHAFTWKVGQHA